MSNNISRPTPLIPQPLTLNVTCISCEYNLRGMMTNQTCPECGLNIGMSLSPNRLIFADREWLRQLARSTDLALLGIFVTTAILIFLRISITPSSKSSSTTEQFVGLCVGAAFVAVPSSLIVRAVWLFTTPEPEFWDVRQHTNRQFVRIMAAAVIIFLVAAFAIGVGQTFLFSRWPEFSLWLFPLFWFGAIFAVVAMGAGTNYAASLAQRVPAPRLKIATFVIGWSATVVGSLAAIAPCVVAVIFRYPGLPLLLELLAISTSIGGLALIFNYRRMFRQLVQQPS